MRGGGRRPVLTETGEKLEVRDGERPPDPGGLLQHSVERTAEEGDLPPRLGVLPFSRHFIKALAAPSLRLRRSFRRSIHRKLASPARSESTCPFERCDCPRRATATRRTVRRGPAPGGPRDQYQRSGTLSGSSNSHGTVPSSPRVGPSPVGTTLSRNPTKLDNPSELLFRGRFPPFSYSFRHLSANCRTILIYQGARQPPRLHALTCYIHFIMT